MGMAEVKPEANRCPQCGAPPMNINEFDALRRFAHDVMCGNYGPGFIQGTTLLGEPDKALDLIRRIDSDLRQKAKAALKGERV